MRRAERFPWIPLLVLLGIVAAVRLCLLLAGRLPAFLSPEAVAAALFLYAPLVRYRRDRAPTWLSWHDPVRSATTLFWAAAAGAAAYGAYRLLPPLPFLPPPPAGGPSGLSGEFLLRQAVFVALPEEVFFRGYLYDAFEEAGLAPVVSTAVLFAAAHLLLQPSAYRALTVVPGLVLGAARKRTGNLYVPAALHLLFNALPPLFEAAP